MMDTRGFIPQILLPFIDIEKNTNGDIKKESADIILTNPISQLPIPKQILIENFSIESEKIENLYKSSLEKKGKVD